MTSAGGPSWLNASRRPLSGSTGLPEALLPKEMPATRFAYDAASSVLASVRAVVAEVAGAAAFRPASYDSVKASLENMLKHDVPPVQLPSGAAAGRRELITAAWLDRIRVFGDRPSSLVKAIADAAFQHRMSKWIEMSYVLEEWRLASAASA
jgi:hypothetical protein